MPGLDPGIHVPIQAIRKMANPLHHGDTENTENHGGSRLHEISVALRVLRVSVVNLSIRFLQSSGRKTWMPGSSPGMTAFVNRGLGLSMGV